MKVLVDQSILSHRLVGQPVHDASPNLLNPLLLIEGVQPQNLRDAAVIKSLPTIAKLASDGTLTLYTNAELLNETMKTPGAYPFFHYGDVFQSVDFEYLPSAIERGKFFQGQLKEHLEKEAVVRFCEWLLGVDENQLLGNAGVVTRLKPHERESFAKLGRFRELCGGISRNHFPDIFHVWSAEIFELEVFLTADARLLRVLRARGRPRTLCKLRTPAELLQELDIKERIPNYMVDTTNTKCCASDAPAHKEGAGAPGDEIVVTEEMVKAVEEMLSDFNGDYESSSDLARRICERILLMSFPSSLKYRR
jgi:hypothetical protein